MKSLTRNFLHVLALCSLVFVTACKDDDPDVNNDPDGDQKDMTVKEVMEEEPEYSHMNDAVEESEQSDFFNNTSANITVFAATNSAFEDLFAEANVSSASELEAQMGEEAFAKMIMYHAINGKFDYSDFGDGSQETFAEDENEARLTVYVRNENGERLVLNGNDGNGAATTSTATIETANGNIIEVDGVVRAQTNYENVEDAEHEHESHYYVDLMTNAETSTVNRLDSESDRTTVLVTNDAQTEAAMRAYFRNMIQEGHIQALLAGNAQSDLFTKYNVTTVADLMAVITYDDVVDGSTVTMADLFAEFEAGNRTAYMNHFIFDGYADFEDKAENNGEVTSEAGITYDVSSNTLGNVVLTDNDGNEIVLKERSSTSSNGSVYTINEVR